MGGLFYSPTRKRWIAEVSAGSPPNRRTRRRVCYSKAEGKAALRSLQALYAPTTSTMTVGA